MVTTTNTGAQTREMKVLVRGKSENATKMNLTAGKFNIVIDEPASLAVPMMVPRPFRFY